MMVEQYAKVWFRWAHKSETVWKFIAEVAVDPNKPTTFEGMIKAVVENSSYDNIYAEYLVVYKTDARMMKKSTGYVEI